MKLHSALWASLSVCAFTFAGAASGQSTPPDTAVKIDSIKVSAPAVNNARVSPLQAQTLPVTASVTAARVRETVNVVDAEDAVKYLPSVFLRKRNYGDTQATLATRVWGVSSSARSLIFADGVPLAALVANNNNIGGPRWGLVSLVEIERIDMMYGPFSAAYAGNSMGAVMEITTRLPQSLEASVEQTGAVQTFDLYGTKASYGTAQTSAVVGNRFDRFSFWASANFQDSHSQPLAYATSGTIPSGTTGAYPSRNKLNVPSNILGATGLQHTGMTNGKVKLAYDLTPAVRAAYTFGYWRNDASAGVQTYLENSSSQPTFASQSGFANGYFDWLEQHSSHSLSVRSDRRRDWDFELVGSSYRFDKDEQRLPSIAAASDTTFGAAGRIASLNGTGWETLDLKGVWHRGGLAATHTVSFGVHGDRYHLDNPTFNTDDWRSGAPTSIAAEGDGKTRTAALWAQDAWWLTPNTKLTLGGRYEGWRAYDGFNANGSTTVVQPVVTAAKFSPKATLAWSPTLDWTFTGSIGRAYRFATPAELYQLITTGSTFTSPDPHLKPDDVLASEVRVERRFSRVSLQWSVFQDDVHDAIISQFLPLVQGSSTLYSYLSNVDHVRARGTELSFELSDFLIPNLEISASGTYLDARTLALSGRASASAPAGSAVGKRLPNIPDRRATFVTTYRPIRRLALSFAGRYNGKIYTTLDNADVNPNTYQGFSEWFVADAHVNYDVTRHWSTSIGADNLFNRKYFLFHPFPQRSFIGSVKYSR